MESICEKVLFLLNKSKEHSCTDDELNKIISYIDEMSDNLVLGIIFGYSLSDYAIASLKWIGTEKTLLKYQEIYSNLNKERKMMVDDFPTIPLLRDHLNEEVTEMIETCIMKKKKRH